MSLSCGPCNLSEFGWGRLMKLRDSPGTSLNENNSGYEVSSVTHIVTSTAEWLAAAGLDTAGLDTRIETVQKPAARARTCPPFKVERSSCYFCAFFLPAPFARFSFTLNFTILTINVRGMG